MRWVSDRAGRGIVDGLAGVVQAAGTGCAAAANSKEKGLTE